jgi:hypothetical protein
MDVEGGCVRICSIVKYAGVVTLVAACESGPGCIKCVWNKSFKRNEGGEY